MGLSHRPGLFLAPNEVATTYLRDFAIERPSMGAGAGACIERLKRERLIAIWRAGDECHARLPTPRALFRLGPARRVPALPARDGRPQARAQHRMVEMTWFEELRYSIDVF